MGSERVEYTLPVSITSRIWSVRPKVFGGLSVAEQNRTTFQSGVGPRFPVGGGAGKSPTNPPRWGAPTSNMGAFQHVSVSKNIYLDWG